MNEINFNVEDIEQVDLSIGMGIKEIYPPIENLEVTPSKEQQVFKHENSYGYDEVVVEPIPDEYIIPNGTLPITENATYDVRKFARVSASVHPAPTLQDKEVTPNKEVQTITSDEGYDGLNQVIVNSIPNNYIEPSGTLEITANGTYDVKEYEKATVNMEGVATPYSPKYLRFQNYEGTDLSYELENLDTSNMTSFYFLFSNCSYVKSLDVAHFNTSNVKDFTYLFNNCNQAKINISKDWDTSKVTTMQNAFNSCRVITELDLSNWNTSNVTNIEAMFNSCSGLQRLDLKNWTIPKITNLNNLFNNCDVLTYLDIRNFDFTNITRYSNIFNNVPNNCEIIVKDDTAKSWVLARRSDFTNVKTVAEL